VRPVPYIAHDLVSDHVPGVAEHVAPVPGPAVDEGEAGATCSLYCSWPTVVSDHIVRSR
jgi:hypothetical protein